MYSRFIILAVKPLLGEKAIVIESNYEISALSVTPENIRIANPSDSLDELLWKEFSISGKVITLFLTSEPLINYRYVVHIQGLKNIIEDELETNYKQSIEFKSYISSRIRFIYPNMHDVVPKLEIKLQEDVLDEKQGPADYFIVQLSSDPLFQNNLLPEQKVYTPTMSFDLDYKGQVFVRCKAHYSIKIEAQTGVEINECVGDWVTTTCVLGLSNESDNNENAFIETTLDVIETPEHNQIEENLVYVFNTEELLSVGHIQVAIKPILGNAYTYKNITFNSAILNNMLVISPQEILPENHLITVTLKNVQATGGNLPIYTHSFCGVLYPCYSNFSDIKSILNSDIELDPELAYYHLIEASKLADYYSDIKLKGNLRNRKYYNQVEYANDLEKNMFVKYYAANQIFSQIRSSILYQMSLGGKLGEIELTPKASLPDLTSFLKGLTDEAQKWKLALQGHKDHTVDFTSAVKSKSCLPHEHYRGGR